MEPLAQRRVIEITMALHVTRLAWNDVSLNESVCLYNTSIEQKYSPLQLSNHVKFFIIYLENLYVHLSVDKFNQ